MGTPKPIRSDKTSAYLRLLGNPYASLQIAEEPAISSQQVLRTAEQRAYISLLENPYASLSLQFAPETSANRIAHSPRKDEAEKSMSKADFRKVCNGILHQYMPALERGRLRAHYKNFVQRNESRPATGRFALVQQLRKYDLSGVRGIQVRFNRERYDVTEEKLKRVERNVFGRDR